MLPTNFKYPFFYFGANLPLYINSLCGPHLLHSIVTIHKFCPLQKSIHSAQKGDRNPRRASISLSSLFISLSLLLCFLIYSQSWAFGRDTGWFSIIIEWRRSIWTRTRRTWCIIMIGMTFRGGRTLQALYHAQSHLYCLMGLCNKVYKHLDSNNLLYFSFYTPHGYKFKQLKWDLSV